MHIVKSTLQLMSNRIQHSGVVESVKGDCVSVRIVQTSACAACKVSGYCNAAEKKVKVVEVNCRNASSYTVGQTVMVSASGTVAFRALLWGFGVPFVVLVGVLLLVLAVTGSEGYAALAGISALGPYYLVLWLCRDRMREQLAFCIEG